MAQQDNAWESAWRSAFENKSIAPPDEVWNSIDAELTQRKKKKLLPLWWAAAGISILAATGLWMSEYFAQQEIQQKNNVALNQTETKSATNSAGKINTETEGKEKEKQNTGGAVASDEGKNISNVPAVVNSSDNSAQQVAVADGNEALYEFLPNLVEKISEFNFKLELPEVGEIWGVAMPYSAKKRSASSWYAGVDFSAGTTTSDADNGMLQTQLLAGPSTQLSNDFQNSSSSVSQSTSMGVTVGKKIARRIIIESGVNYLRIQNTGTSNLAFNSSAGMEAFNSNADLRDAVVTTTTPYELQHVHQFISIPVKAGYLIVDDKWKFSVNGGVSGDYFLKTYTEDLSGALEVYEANPSGDDQWKTFSMSLIGEINLARQLGKHYFIAVSPQLRRSMSDLSNTSTELKPMVLQVGVQLKYQFE